MRADEFDRDGLARLMMLASDLDTDVGELNPLLPTDDEQEALDDARYHARKLRRLLFRLAQAADEGYKAWQQEEVSSGQGTR